MNATLRVRNLVLLGILAAALAAFKTEAVPQKWDAASFTSSSPTVMVETAQSLGGDGWEIASCYPTPLMSSSQVTCLFKRPLP